MLSALKELGLITESVVAQILSQPHTGFSVWAALIKQIYEIDPLLRPKCGSEMKIKSFVLNPVEIKRIMASLGLPDYRAPPPLPSSSNYYALTLD